jgi:hypothetical protein
MGVLEAVARMVQLGGAPSRAARVAEMRARYEEKTGAFAPDDTLEDRFSGRFEERSRAFWCDAVTRARFGREVEAELTVEERGWLEPLDRAHRGLFRAEGEIVVDVWSGAELAVTLVDDVSRAELAAADGQLFDARLVGWDEGGLGSALLPGALFHPRDATAAIGAVLPAGRARGLSTDDMLDALLRMERMLRSMSRVKAAYAYRPEALAPHATAPARRPARVT